MEFYWYLSITLWLPIIGAVLTGFVSKNLKIPSKYWATTLSGINFLFSLGMWYLYVQRNTDLGMQWVAQKDGFAFYEYASWINTSTITVQYSLGVDGLSMPLLVLTNFIFFVSIWSSYFIHEREDLYYGLMLLLQTGVLGTFIALDFVIFYIAWEIVLVPMFFIIAIWGGANRRYASFKFFIYTHLASLVMLIGIFMIFQQTNSLYLPEVKAKLANVQDIFTLVMIFYLLAIGFIVKFPQVPFHTWLPDAHVQAPSPGSSILAGILLKMGGYGLIRFTVWLLPQRTFQAYGNQVRIVLGLIGVISMAYTGFVALRQLDLKRMIAYSSIAHMGVVSLGVAAYNVIGINAAIYMMIAHGIISPALFLISGIIEHHVGTRNMNLLGGFGNQMPKVTGLFVYNAFASAGLPGLAGFVAEVLMFIAIFTDKELFGVGRPFVWVSVIAVLSVILTAGYYLWAVQRVVFGPVKEEYSTDEDGHSYEIGPLILLSFATLMLGIFPFLIMNVLNEFSTALF